jgi:outer membrane protein assembly factor BamB
VQWKTPRTSPVKNRFSFSTPLTIEVSGERQIISAGSGFVGAYHPSDGRELWRVNFGEGFSVVPRPVFAHGLVFICTGFNTASLLAIKPDGARGDVTATNVVWSHRKGVPTTPSPIVVDDEIYFVSDGGVATCLNSRTGEVHWNERLGGDFSASPVAAEGKIYFQNETGVAFVLKAGKTFELLATNDLAERAFASVAILDNALIIRSESHLWRVGK